MANKTFKYVTKYDDLISKYFQNNNLVNKHNNSVKKNLKYGMNPHQKAVIKQSKNILEVLNGNPGYINYLDAYPQTINYEMY